MEFDSRQIGFAGAMAREISQDRIKAIDIESARMEADRRGGVLKGRASAILTPQAHSGPRDIKDVASFLGGE